MSMSSTALDTLFATFASTVQDSLQVSSIRRRVRELFERDTAVQVLENDAGQLCPSYPSELYLPTPPGSPLPPNLFDAAKHARVRTRFPVPVLRLGRAYLVRSATLSQKIETMARGYVARVTSLANTLAGQAVSDYEPAPSIDLLRKSDCQECAYNRIQGLSLIEALGVAHIADLMVEGKKVVLGVELCSSEKSDTQGRYSHLGVQSLPYPGVEFFTPPQLSSHSPIDWAALAPTAELCASLACDSDWATWQQWDLTRLTGRYLRHMLDLLKQGGLLVHCLSGWDRTPLFVSLIRLSLWADGRVHASLAPSEILYLTVAYDWFLFEHQLRDRLSKEQLIFYFCFEFLSQIHGPEYACPADSDDELDAFFDEEPVMRRGSVSLGHEDKVYGSWQLCEVPELAEDLPKGRAARLSAVERLYKQHYQAALQAHEPSVISSVSRLLAQYM